MSCLCTRLPRIFAPSQCRPFSSLRIISDLPLRFRSSSFHSTGALRSRKRHTRDDYFSSSAPRFIQQDAKPEKSTAESEGSPPNNKRKNTRSHAAKNSLRRVAVEAQRSRDGTGLKKTATVAPQATSKVRYPLGLLTTDTDCSLCIDCHSNLRC